MKARWKLLGLAGAAGVAATGALDEARRRALATVAGAKALGVEPAQGAVFGGTIAVRLLPALLLGPIAGVIADRFDRKLIMIGVNLVRAVVLGILTVTIVSETISIAVVLVIATTAAFAAE